MQPGRRMFLDYELGTFFICLVPSVLYAVSEGLLAGFKLFLIGFLIVQPFLLFAFRDELPGRRSKKNLEWTGPDGTPRSITVTQKNEMRFPDGSTISWLDRESLMYEEGRHVAVIWSDFGPFFSFPTKRVIRMSSLEKWSNLSTNRDDPIPEDKRADIVAKVRAYYARKRVELAP